MHGALWDVYIIVTPALAGASPRTLYVHPSSKGKLECITEATDDERAIALAALRTRGVSDKTQALHPELRPAVRRKGPQEHIGSEEVQALLLGGRRAAHAPGGAAAGFGLGTVSSQVALAVVGAASSSAGPPLPPPALPPAAAASTSGVSASASADPALPPPPGVVALAADPTAPRIAGVAATSRAQQPGRREHLTVVAENEAHWCGWNLTLWNRGVWAYSHGSWWRLWGPDPVFHPYSNDHWWEHEDDVHY